LSNFDEEKAVGQLAELVALECGIGSAEAKLIRTAAVLHDVGKQKIPAEIINKPGKLTKQEFEIIKTHTTLGAEMLKSIQGDLGVMARNICLYHHETYSGNGYWGKLADEVPFYVQLVTISDIFAALICVRPYKDAWPSEDALAYIQKKSGTIFDPKLVEIFLPLVREDSRVRDILSGR